MRAAGLRTAVVIPVYRAEYLEGSLASVFGQTRSPDHVIVVDDGSPQRYAIDMMTRPWRSRLTVLRQENRGAGAARNRGIRSTTADLIAFIDADDVWHPTFLDEQVTRLAQMPEATLVYSNARIVGSGPLAGRLFMDGAPSAGDVTSEALLAQRCTVLTSSVVVHRQALLSAGLFDEELRRGQDFDLWVRLAHRGARFAYTKQPLVDRRIHADNLSGDTLSALERAVAVLEKLRIKLVLTDAERRALDRRVDVLSAQILAEHGKRSLTNGDLAQARAHFERAGGAGRSWKLRLVTAGLKIAPQLTRHVYLRRAKRDSVHSDCPA